MGKTSTDSKRKYNEKAYERLYITIPKGQKERIQAFVKEKGFSSINALVWRLLSDEMKGFNESADE